MSVENIIELTDDQFEAAVAETGTPLLVDFWAEWCGPCVRMAPVIDEVAQEFDGRLRVAKVNIDQHQGAANQYGVQSIPTLLFFKGGKLVNTIVGAQRKDQLVSAIEAIL
jgi:thioredoxin 1